MGKRGPQPLRAADPVWTPELAYAVGLMATDGCLVSDGRHLNFTSKDHELIVTFCRILGLQNVIGRKSNGAGSWAFQVQFGDVTLYRWFVALGMTPRKSLTIGPLAVPDGYFFDFLRGAFDGDGSSYAYWDTRWHSSVSLYINFACASRVHVEWLHQTIKRLLGVSGSIGWAARVYDLRFSKGAAKHLYDAMYYSDAIPHLKRKKEKLDRQWETLARSRNGERPPTGYTQGVAIRIA